MGRINLSGSILFILLVGVLIFVQPFHSGGAEVADKTPVTSDLLVDRHAAKKIGCQGCHDVEGTPKVISSEKCLKCHRSYEYMAEKTKELAINPHDSHFGKIECLGCHKAHKQSVLYCNKCHEFDMKVP